jgi:hypothetical protein
MIGTSSTEHLGKRRRACTGKSINTLLPKRGDSPRTRSVPGARRERAQPLETRGGHCLLRHAAARGGDTMYFRPQRTHHRPRQADAASGRALATSIRTRRSPHSEPITPSSAHPDCCECQWLPIDQAFERLRHHARTHNLRLADLARDTVNGEVDPSFRATRHLTATTPTRSRRPRCGRAPVGCDDGRPSRRAAHRGL